MRSLPYLVMYALFIYSFSNLIVSTFKSLINRIFLIIIIHILLYLTIYNQFCLTTYNRGKLIIEVQRSSFLYGCFCPPDNALGL
jgi:hypothetical protein